MIARLFRFSLPRKMSSFPRKMSTSPRGMSLFPRGMSLSSGVDKLPFYRQIPQIERAHGAENKILFPRKMSLLVFGVGTHRICLLSHRSKPGKFAMCIYTCCACYSSKTKRSESISPRSKALFSPCYIINNADCAGSRAYPLSRWGMYGFNLCYCLLRFFQSIKLHCKPLGFAAEFPVPKIGVHFLFSAFSPFADEGNG